MEESSSKPNIINLSDVEPVSKPDTFHSALRSLINHYSMENESNTPDYILAGYLSDCLDAYNNAIDLRDKFYGPPDEDDEPTHASAHMPQ